MEYTHVIFGECACQLLAEDESLAELKEGIINGIPYQLETFIEGVTSVGEILDIANGWNDYAMLDAKEFNELNKII